MALPFAPVSYRQDDKAWKDVDYSAKGEKTTIGASGCGPTAAAIIASTWWDLTTPVEVAKWALSHGYKAPNQGTYYSFFKAYFKEVWGGECTQLNGSSLYGKTDVYSNSIFNTAKDAVKHGDLVIACVGKSKWTSSGHFIVFYGIDSWDNCYFRDPIGRCEYATAVYFKSVTKYLWVVKQPANFTIPNEYEGQVKFNNNEGNIRYGANEGYEIYEVAHTGDIFNADTELDTGWVRMLGFDGKRYYTYKDNVDFVTKPVTTQWYEPYINKLKELGIFEGDENGNIHPDQPVTTAHMAAALCKTLQYLKGDYKQLK